MMKTVLLPLAAVALLGAGAAFAEPYVDYTPQKGLWHVVTVKVMPSHIDDYVSSLKKLWLPGEELAKKHGLIDSYQIMVKMNASDGKGNVVLIEHIPNMALLEPDQARDQAMEKEAYAMVPKAQGEAQVKTYDTYREFVGDEYWTALDYTK